MKFVYVASIIAVLVIVSVIIFANSGSDPTYDSFAKCLSDKGLKFYGAYWCPHCQEQKQLFGKSADKLPYIECSLPNQAGQTAVCQQAGILSYPTWELPSGKRIEGTLSVEELSTLSGCALNSTA